MTTVIKLYALKGRFHAVYQISEYQSRTLPKNATAMTWGLRL